MMVFYCSYLLILFSVSFMSGVIDVMTGVIIWVMFVVVIVVVKFVFVFVNVKFVIVKFAVVIVVVDSIISL